MTTYARQLLSGSTNGQPIKIAAVATPGTLIHTAIESVIAFNEIYTWITNTSNAAVLLTIEFGGPTDPDDLIVKQLSIPPNSAPIPILTGQNLNNGLTVKMFASVANVLLATGYVNVIS